MELIKLFENIKSDFCGLTNYKLRGNVLEIITPYSTLNKKFVSVFLKIYQGKYVVTDGGWIFENYYESPDYEESKELIDRILTYYLASYNIKITSDKAETIYYYKTCIDQKEVSSIIFDVASFLVGVINASCIQYKDVKEEKDRSTFKKDVDNFLKLHYLKKVKFHSSLEDFKHIKFNATIIKGSSLYLITYVTGSTHYYFDNDLRRTIVNYEIADRSKSRLFIKEKLCIINDEAVGYHTEESNPLIGLLNERTSQKPIKWTEKNKLLELV